MKQSQIVGLLLKNKFERSGCHNFSYYSRKYLQKLKK
jgi:hypothetical protein